MKLNSFVYYRAIAIFFIVVWHVHLYIRPDPDHFLESAIINFINGGTTLFVFISGFLFYQVYYSRFTYSAFLRVKARYILLPYLILSTPVIISRLIKGNYGVFFKPTGDGFFQEYIVPGIKLYLSGNYPISYWYIPFVVLLFLCAPLHKKIIDQKTSTQLLIAISLGLVSMFMHRPALNNPLPVFQSLLYYTPVYLFGILCSIHREFIYQKLCGKELFILALAIGLSCLESYTGHFGNYHKAPLAWAGVDLMFCQKVVLCLFFMVWLHRFEQRHNPLLEVIASTSFAIYFLHEFALIFLLKVVNKAVAFDSRLTPLLGLNSWFTYILLVIGALTMSVVAALILKRLLPKQSRMMIGY
ncbi:acyltransferase [Halioxenophilus sp. WMMB6]|uniref:acyltransferase n=1 Tax=Halioxenophilus sp. WMMB6 TaxID=3073815 RepID=UPI00295ED4FB|nr:acyltransferase [Halioxenophilus sp. WMMB6]